MQGGRKRPLTKRGEGGWKCEADRIPYSSIEGRVNQLGNEFVT